MKNRMSGMARTVWASAAVVALGSGVAMGPGIVASAAATPQLILPNPHLRELQMTSMTSGWALGMNNELYYTQNGGRHWTTLATVSWPRFLVGDKGSLAWGVTWAKGSTTPAIMVGAVSTHGKLWHHTIDVPGKHLVLLQWSATAISPLAGLVLSGRTSPSTLAEQVWTFNAQTRQASLSYDANPVPSTESPMTALSVESAHQVWGVSISPGPGPGLWSIRSGQATPVPLPIPHGLTQGPVGPMKPAPIAGPQFLNGTGFLAADYQTIALGTQAQVADALLYRTRGHQWIPVWHRPGYMDFVDFVTPKVGWLEWTAVAGARPELLQTVNGGRTFNRLPTPGPGLPVLLNAHDGWWIDLSSATKLWRTTTGGRSWIRVRVRA